MNRIKNYNIFSWILNSSIYYTDSDAFLNIIYDYKLNHLINDLSTWKDKIIEIEFESILEGKNQNIMDFINKMELKTKPLFVLNIFYEKYNILQFIQEFCSDISNEEFCLKDNNGCVNKIILIALIYAEFNCEIRRDFIYSMVDLIITLPDINKIISQIILNVKYTWDYLIKSNENKIIEFQKNISVEKKIKNKNILKYYGFNYKTNKNIFNNGLKFGIGGICDLIVCDDFDNTNLFELKTCLKTSFSNEWVLQIIIYNILLGFIQQTEIKSNFIVNLFDGTIYKIHFKSNIMILKTILKLYDYDDYLINFILS